jgi:hypothetical protein
MWMWTEQEKYLKLLKIAQKWMEFDTDTNIDDKVLDDAFRKSQTTAKSITDKLEFKTPETTGFIGAWVELGLFVGYIAGWKDSSEILAKKPLSAALYPASLDAYTKVDWATPYAMKYAFTATEDVFTKITAPPVSPVIQGFSSKEIDTLRETYERSLFVGYLLGVESAESKEKCAFEDLELISTLEI